MVLLMMMMFLLLLRMSLFLAQRKWLLILSMFNDFVQISVGIQTSGFFCFAFGFCIFLFDFWCRLVQRNVSWGLSRSCDLSIFFLGLTKGHLIKWWIFNLIHLLIIFFDHSSHLLLLGCERLGGLDVSFWFVAFGDGADKCWCTLRFHRFIDCHIFVFIFSFAWRFRFSRFFLRFFLRFGLFGFDWRLGNWSFGFCWLLWSLSGLGSGWCLRLRRSFNSLSSNWSWFGGFDDCFWSFGHWSWLWSLSNGWLIIWSWSGFHFRMCWTWLLFGGRNGRRSWKNRFRSFWSCLYWLCCSRSFLNGLSLSCWSLF